MERKFQYQGQLGQSLDFFLQERVNLITVSFLGKAKISYTGGNFGSRESNNKQPIFIGRYIQANYGGFKMVRSGGI